MHQRQFKTAITYGTFDLFHHGHARLLSRVAELAERVVVACSTDEFNAIKGKKTVIPFADRVEVLRACRFVDLVIPEKNWEQKPVDILRYRADVFVMGDDWAGKFDELKAFCTVHYLPRTEHVSSTQIKALLRDHVKEPA